MIDPTSIQAAIGGLQAAGNIAKSFIGLRDMTTLQFKTIELQNVILSAQDSALTAKMEQSSLIDRVRDLEEEVTHLKAWDAEKKKYALTEIAREQFAYVLKEEADAPEPPHKLCANCYNRNEKSILQTETRNPGRQTVYFCQNCGGEIFSRKTGGRHPNHKRPRVITKKPR